MRLETRAQALQCRRPGRQLAGIALLTLVLSAGGSAYAQSDDLDPAGLADLAEQSTMDAAAKERGNAGASNGPTAIMPPSIGGRTVGGGSQGALGQSAGQGSVGRNEWQGNTMSVSVPSGEGLPAVPSGVTLRNEKLVRQFYAAWGKECAWSPARLQTLSRTLANASKHALDPRLFDLPAENASFETRGAVSAGGTCPQPARDWAISDAALEYAKIMTQGRVSLRDIHEEIILPRASRSVSTEMATALRYGSLADWLASLPPQHPAYQRLVTAYAAYSELTEGPSWTLVKSGETLRLGDVDPRVPTLRKRLIESGDLKEAEAAAAMQAQVRWNARTESRMASSAASADGGSTGASGTERFDAPLGNADDWRSTEGGTQAKASSDPQAQTPPSNVYDEAIVAAVKRFQKRHGLISDGIAGPNTVTAINVPISKRFETIQVNLARWRSMSFAMPKTRVEVNIPDYQLTLFENDRPSMGMRVIVGETEHPTPIIRDNISQIVFNPAWHVPKSIIEKEMIPKIKRDPNYLKRNHMSWKNGIIVQEPGPWNALGTIKFDFPNRYAIYLHDTSARSRFNNAYRALSHGCVRVQKPQQLAERVLQGNSGWDTKKIKATLEKRETKYLKVGDPLPVVLAYWTAFVESDGEVNFRGDLYEYDKNLKEALVAYDKQHLPRGARPFEVGMAN